MVAAQSSRAPRTDCSRKHWSNLTSFRIITVGGGKRYDGLLTGSFSIYAGNKPLCCSGDIQGLYMSCLLLHCPVLLQKHILFLTCLWKQFASLKGRYFRCFVCSFLSCKYSALKKKKKNPWCKDKVCSGHGLWAAGVELGSPWSQFHAQAELCHAHDVAVNWTQWGLMVSEVFHHICFYILNRFRMILFWHPKYKTTGYNQYTYRPKMFCPASYWCTYMQWRPIINFLFYLFFA